MCTEKGSSSEDKDLRHEEEFGLRGNRAKGMPLKLHFHMGWDDEHDG